MSNGTDKIFDVVIVGGGVIGCAVLHELTNYGYKCLLMEKENALVSGASSGNSGIAHIGFDATPGTLEEKCLSDSNPLLAQLLSSYSITTRRLGAIIVAWSNEEVAKLSEIEGNAVAVGVHSLKRLNRDELLQLEPNLCREALGGLLVPEESAIDSWMLPITLAHSAIRHGACVKTCCGVESGVLQPTGLWLLKTNMGGIQARVVVNAAGLYGDTVEKICQKPSFSVKPRRGQFIVYNKDAGKLIHHMILPVPSERTKGVLIFPSAYGNLVVGPTAEDCSERTSPTLSDDVTRRLIEYGRRIVPALSQYQVIATYAGLRPATETKDYHLYATPERRWITVAGIRSTGVSACLAIAGRVRRMIESNAEFDVRPSVDLPRSTGFATWWPTTDGSAVVMDGTAYEVTHPLSRLGLSQTDSALTKSRL